MGCAGGLTGCHAPGGSPTLGRLANERTRASDEKTASLGNGWQGARRAGTLTRTKPASARLADRDDRPVVKTSQSRENA
jgi:hypothetical protein